MISKVRPRLLVSIYFWVIMAAWTVVVAGSFSLKYAFPKDREGEIRIVLQTINSHELELTVCDDGIGILEEIDMEKTESLGLQRVHILAELHELNNEAL